MFSIFDNFPEIEFYPEVKNNQGKLMPLTEYGKRVTNVWACERVVVIIKSGQEIRNKLLINRLHDMTEGGTYSIRLKTYLFGGKFEGRSELHYATPADVSNPLTTELASNTAQIEIVESNRGISSQAQNAK